jgi:hypothetical protein
VNLATRGGDAAIGIELFGIYSRLRPGRAVTRRIGVDVHAESPGAGPGHARVQARPHREIAREVVTHQRRFSPKTSKRPNICT